MKNPNINRQYEINLGSISAYIKALFNLTLSLGIEPETDKLQTLNDGNTDFSYKNKLKEDTIQRLINIILEKYNLQSIGTENLNKALELFKKGKDIILVSNKINSNIEGILILISIMLENEELFKNSYNLLNNGNIEGYKNYAHECIKKATLLLSSKIQIGSNDGDETFLPHLSEKITTINKNKSNGPRIILLNPELCNLNKSKKYKGVGVLDQNSIELIKQAGKNGGYILNIDTQQTEKTTYSKDNITISYSKPTLITDVLNNSEESNDEYKSNLIKRRIIQLLRYGRKIYKNDKKVKIVLDELIDNVKTWHDMESFGSMIKECDLYNELPIKICQWLDGSIQDITQDYIKNNWNIGRFMTSGKSTQEKGIYSTSNDIQNEALNSSIKAKYNGHYHDQHKANGIKIKALLEDDPLRIVYKRNPGILKMKEQLMLNLLNSFANIIGEGKNKNYEQIMDEIFEALESKSVLIVTNHATFLNFPIIIAELEKHAKKRGKTSILDNIYTILGPALLTQDQKKYIQAISNLLKTIPDTANSKIPGLENEISKIRKQFLKTLLELRKTPGKIFIVAPTGTRDYLYREKNNKDELDTINTIAFESDSDVSGSLSIIRSFAKDNAHIIIAGVNETNLKDPTKVKLGSNDWSSGTGIIGLEHIQPSDATNLVNQGKFMEKLAQNVLDLNKRIIGKAVGREWLNYLKKGTIALTDIFEENLTHGNKQANKKLSHKLNKNFKKKFFRFVFRLLK